MSGAEVFLLAAATGMGAYSQYQQGRAQEAQYNAQAQAADVNARIARQNAETVAQQAGAREDLQRKQARQVIGRQLAATAESGVHLNGTAGDLLEESMGNAELDALNIRYEGEVNRTGLLNQANMFDYEAKINRGNAKQARRQANVSAATTLLSGGYQLGKAGGFSGFGGSFSGTGISSGASGTGFRSTGGTGFRAR